MTIDLTFKDVCKLLKKDAGDDGKLIRAIDTMAGLVITCGAVAFGNDLTASLQLIGVKNELTRIGAWVVERFTQSQSNDDYVARDERMKVAYGLLVFTAFFDTLDARLPDSIRQRLARSGLAPIPNPDQQPSTDDAEFDISLLPIRFPHPTESLRDQAGAHRDIWERMAQGIDRLLAEALGQQDGIRIAKSNILFDVEKRFESQYYELARRFPEFALWAFFNDRRNAADILRRLSADMKRGFELCEANRLLADVGFDRLRQMVFSLPARLRDSDAAAIIDSLARHHRGEIDKTIIPSKYFTHDSDHHVSFPRIREAFIPQAFQLRRQTDKQMPLSIDETWEKVSARDDFDTFIPAYLSSPYSRRHPLLILGEPGSGKSLSTIVLAAQLSALKIPVVRVPLRDATDAEGSVVAQIDEAIRNVTKRSSDSWALLSDGSQGHPPVVLLDGYDELLQLTGSALSGYLLRVEEFQESEFVQERPVIAIVTSRCTLIHRARVPFGTLVIRLLDFNTHQQQRWIAIWNATNSHFFRRTGVEPFALPGSDEVGAEKILSLARQPLLLSMLALYDSSQNALRRSQTLNRTKLYDNLLRRFMTRQRAKHGQFADLDEHQQREQTDAELQRLGVAAFGMHSRERLYISSRELDDDLAFFGLRRPDSQATSAALSPAEILLGSFFFLHKARARFRIGQSEPREAATYEFLHNTFGEFLTADFILREVVDLVVALRASKSSLETCNLRDHFNDSQIGDSIWFVRLVHTPLFNRPIVLGMMREWIPQLLERRALSSEDFCSSLDWLVLNQLNSLLTRDHHLQFPTSAFGNSPLLGQLATYSLNLVLLRTTLCATPFQIDEMRFKALQSRVPPWNQLISIWRSWFALGDFEGLMHVMQAKRHGNTITINSRIEPYVRKSRSPLQTQLDVALCIGDRFMAAVTGFLLFEPEAGSRAEIDAIGDLVDSEKLELGVPILVQQLLSTKVTRDDSSAREFLSLAQHSLRMAFDGSRFCDSERIAQLIILTVNWLRQPQRACGGQSQAYEKILEWLKPSAATEATVKYPRIAPVLWRLAADTADSQWQQDFAGELMRSTFDGLDRLSLTQEYPKSPWAMLESLNDFATDSLVKRFGPPRPHSRFFDKALDPHHLATLSRRNPGAALAWVQWALKVTQENTRCEHDLYHPTQDHFGREIATEDALTLVLEYPPVAAAWLELVRKTSRSQFIGKFSKDFFDSLLRDRVLQKLSELEPKLVLALAELMRTYYGKGMGQKGAPIVDCILHPDHFLKMCEADLQAAISWISLSRRTHRDALTAQLVGIFVSEPLIRRDSAVLIAALRIAARDVKRAQTLDGHLIGAFHRTGCYQVLSEMIPMVYLPDVQSLARRSRNTDLIAALNAVGVDVSMANSKFDAVGG